MTPDRWARVKSVLADVLLAPPGQRAVVLERACAGDPSLAAEVQALVEAEAGAGPLDAPARLDGETQPVDATASTVPLVGLLDDVGPYRLHRRIGRGGMGEVFVATDLRLKREVAIKVVHARFASEPGFAQHLLREARAAARLSHPNIATVFDVVEAGARLYLVMEYLRGETLAAHLSRGPLPLRETVDLGRQMADALGHAHAHGLLHCDFKPANVMLTPDGHVKVLDFGLARTFQGPDSEAIGASASLIRNRAGTPAYMAPEHRLGLPLGPPADVFALGVVLHEMCTGQRPAHLPGLRSPDSATGEARTPLHPSVPRPLQAIVARALHTHPASRFRDGADVAAALSAVAGRPSAGQRAVLSSVGTLLVVAVAAGTMVAGRHEGEGPGERVKPVLAVLPFSGPDDRPWASYLAAGMTEFVTNDLAVSPDLIVVSNGSVRAAKNSAPLPELARELGATHLVQGELQPSDGALRVRVQVFDARKGRTIDAGLVETQARDIARSNRTLAVAVRRRLQQAGLPTGPPPDRGQEWPSAAEVAEDYARGRDLLQHWSEGDNLERAIEAFSRVTAAEPGFPSAHAYLGEASWRKYRRTRDPQWASRAQAATFDALRLGPNDARVRYTAAVVLAGTGRREQALQEARRAIDLQPTSDEAYRLVGRILSDAGDFAGAQPYFDAAITLRPGFAGNYHALGIAAYGHGQLDTAIRAFSRAAELRPTSADAWQALGTAYHASGNLDRALQNYERANAIEPTDFAYSNIGLLHYWNGRYGDAVRAYRRSAELSPNEPVTYRNLADALRRTPERSQAPAAYRRAIELADISLSTNPRQPGLVTLKALCHARLGRARLALELAEQGATEGAQDPEATYQAGVAAEVAGDRARARAWLSRALELGYSKSLMDRDEDLDDLRRAGWP